jgi:hypothetical protein
MPKVGRKARGKMAITKTARVWTAPNGHKVTVKSMVSTTSRATWLDTQNAYTITNYSCECGMVFTNYRRATKLQLTNHDNWLSPVDVELIDGAIA